MLPQLDTPLLPSFSLNQGATLKYRLGKRRNGVDIWDTDWREHLILDSGLDKVASYSWPDCFTYMLLGASVSPVPVRRDGGATTFSQSGTTLTASGNFFLAADVGRLFKFGTGAGGSEMKITAYTDATTVTVSTTATVGATVGTIWYVNETALSSLDMATNGYSTGAANNSSILSGDTVTHKRTFLGTAVAAPKTYTEIAFSHSNSNAFVFDRDLITPTVSLATGDQPLAVVVLTVKYSPITPLTVSNVGTGMNSAGQLQIEGFGLNTGIGLKNISSTGASGGAASALEPSAASNIVAINAAITFVAPGDFDPAVRGGTAIADALGGYTNGTFTRTRSATFTTTQANHIIYGFGLAQVNNRCQMTLKLDTSFTKLNTQTLACTFRTSWGRILTN